jgi:hypothetical protein
MSTLTVRHCVGAPRAMKKKRTTPRCPLCGRFARYDAYYSRWWCERDEREVRP